MQKLEIATNHVKANDLAAAIEVLKAILDEDCEQEIATGMLASVYLQIGRTAAAIELYEKLLALKPENPLARFQLGLARLNNGEARQAIDVWAPMLETQDEFMAHFHSALAHLQLRRPQEALDLLLKAGEHMPVGHPLYPQLVDMRNKLTSSRDEA